MSDQASRTSNAGKLLIAGILVGIAIIAFLAIRGQLDEGKGAAEISALQQHLTQLRTALALTENMEPEAAEEHWAGLRGTFPEDSSVALNNALNRTLFVDVLADEATNALRSDAEKKAARQRLPEAISSARAGIADYQKISGDTINSLWLGTRVDLQEAGLLPTAMTKSLRRDIFDRLTQSLAGELGTSVQSVILTGSLSQVLELLQDPIDGLPSELLSKATESISVQSDQHDDNLFLAVRAAQLNIESKQAAAKEFVARTAKLARVIRPLLSEKTKPMKLTADELVAEITSAIDRQDWDFARTRMMNWFNVLNPTELMKTDRRRASPHPLDRLSFQTLRRLSTESIDQEPIEQGRTELSFQLSTIDAANDVSTLLPIDFNLDLISDIAAITADGNIQLWQYDQRNWTSAAEIQLDIQPTGLCAADLFMVDSSDRNRIKTEIEEPQEDDQPDYSKSARHDTFPGLVAYGDDGVRLIALDGRRSTAAADRMQVVDKQTGLEEVTGVTKIVTGDLEGDGDLDLIVATEAQAIRLFINRGDRTFFEATEHGGGFDPSDSVVDMAIADIDRDLDLDVVTLLRSGQVGILENLLHLQFRGRVIDEIPATAGASSILVADIDGNVSWDLVIAGEQATTLVFSQTADAGMWTVERVEADQQAMPQATLVDLDNDAWFELVSAGTAGIGISRLGPWGLDSSTTLPTLKLSSVVITADFNSDGKLDLAGIDGGKIQVAVNQTESSNHYMDVRFKGIDDNAANSGRVNHFAIGSVLELRFGPHYRSQIINSPATHFGLDGYDSAGSVRVIFPNGLTQTIRDPGVDTIVEEEQSLKGSCPYLYAWDGEKCVFVTDCLWAAPLGLQVARGVVAKDRPWEYLKVDGRHLKPRDGRYQLRITEELWETVYVDKVALTTIDHPPDVQIWTNEKVGPAEIAEPQVFAFRDSELRPLAAALDTKGRDVTDQLSKRDRDFVQGFDRRLRQGLCPPHWIDLDFGESFIDGTTENAASIYLVLTGWILPTDTSLNIQIDQNPELPPIEFPSVWVPDGSQPGGWRKAIPFMGFPGGKTKTIVVDVTDVINMSDPRFRIRTSAQIYWDDAQLAVKTEPAEFVQQPTELIAAQLAYHGYSARIREGVRSPEVYDYQQSTKAPRWPPLRGSLTQFGRCDRLVHSWDDEMVVMSSGDELQLTFSLPKTPLREGWRRDFVLHCVGWDKDADLNTLTGQSTGPLPHRGMGQYPPTASGLAELRAVEQKNRAHLRRHQSFRAFWYRRDGSAPSPFLTPAFDGF